MRIDKAIGIIGGIFILAGIGSMLFLPGEKKWNKDADIRVGSGADISGVIMEETLQEINENIKFPLPRRVHLFRTVAAILLSGRSMPKKLMWDFIVHTLQNIPLKIMKMWKSTVRFS